MNYTIENEALRVTIASLGAEVLGVYNKATGEDVWWYGDPQYWHGHSPILFPACGGLWDGKYLLNGKEYNMPKHGFVRKAEFDVSDDRNAERISFSYRDNQTTHQYFPFPFCLTITYSLTGGKLSCVASVQNTGSETMHYQIGGHPAIKLPDFTPEGGTIGYACIESENTLSIVRAGEQGCWGPERFRVPCAENGMIPICLETFNNEALIFDNSQVRKVHLFRADGKTRIASITCLSPVTLMWQPQGMLSPFVCVEPWYGLCDRQGYTMDLDYRPYCQHVLAGDTNSHLLFDISI